MVHAVRLRDVGEMIKYNRRGNALFEDRHDLQDLGGRRVDLDVPAELVDPLGQRLQHLGRCSAGLGQIEADAANAERVHALEYGRLHPNKVLAAIQDRLDPTAIVINDGGDFLAFGRVGLSTSTMLDPGPFGCIGVGVPYGIAASLAFPDRQVLVATGDGAFGFNAIEIDTAVRHKAPVVIVVANNGAWQIEVHDQTVTHGKIVGTRLQFSDYAAMARAFGMHGERVEKPEDLGPALDRAFKNRPALVDVVVTPEAISSDGKTGLAWVPDLQALAAWDEAERKWRSS